MARTITFGLHADLWAALEAYRVPNCAEASVAAAARELVRAALARSPEAGTVGPAHSEAMRGVQR